jgi:hypothetical protein
MTSAGVRPPLRATPAPEAQESGVLVGRWASGLMTHLTPWRLRVAPEAPVEIEAGGMAVEFEPGAGGGAGVDDGGLVDAGGFALQEEAAGEVAEHVDVGILGGADEALGVLGLVAGGDVETGDHHVEFWARRSSGNRGRP